MKSVRQLNPFSLLRYLCVSAKVWKKDKSILWEDTLKGKPSKAKEKGFIIKYSLFFELDQIDTLMEELINLIDEATLLCYFSYSFVSQKKIIIIIGKSR